MRIVIVVATIGIVSGTSVLPGIHHAVSGADLIAQVNMLTDSSTNSTQAKHLNPDDYYKMQDPREAARLFRERALEVGRDLNASLFPGWKNIPPRKHYRYVSRHIHLPAGDIYPRRSDRSFVEEARALISEGKGDQPRICLVLFRRDHTLNDIISIMERGIRIYKWLPSTAFLVRMRVDQVPDLAALPFVDWIGRYEPRHKYSSKEVYDRISSTSVVSLEGDKPEFREDLRRHGVITLEYSESGGLMQSYRLKADKDLIVELAELWWVEAIIQWNAVIQFD